MFKSLSILALAALCSLAQAQDVCSPSGALLNTSSNGVASRSSPVTVCTVISINSTDGIESTSVFMAETSEGDAVLELFYTEEPRFPQLTKTGYSPILFPPRMADNWGDLPHGDRLLLQTKLRVPNRPSDAAILLTSDPQYTTYVAACAGKMFAVGGSGCEVPPELLSNYRFGVCAKGYPKEGSAWTNVSISHLGPAWGTKRQNFCYSNTQNFFQKP